MDTTTTELLSAALDQSATAVAIVTANLAAPGPSVVYANPAFCALSGHALDELLGHTLPLLDGSDSAAPTAEQLGRCLDQGGQLDGRSLGRQPDGSLQPIEWRISPLRGPRGVAQHFLVEQRAVAEPPPRLLRIALDATSESLLITDRQGVIVYVNQAFERQTGHRAPDVLGKKPALLRSGNQSGEFYRHLWQTLARGESFHATFTNRRQDGSLFHLEQTITPARDERGEISHYVSVSKDLTEHVEREQALQTLAYSDPLTGLNNRMFGERQLAQEWQRAQRYRRSLAAIMADVDHFKQINDQHGHASGDQVLQLLGKILRDNVRRTDSVIRWGGEEFLILAPDSDEQTAAALAERIRQAVCAHRFPAVGALSISLGVAQLQAGEDRAGLIERADQALYAAKHGGRNRVARASRSGA